MIRIAFVAIVLMLTAAAGALAADRLPNPEERSSIERVLREAGYSGWGKIESDDGRWEVDNAKGPDTRTYDLKLDATSYKIVASKLDD